MWLTVRVTLSAASLIMADMGRPKDIEKTQAMYADYCSGMSCAGVAALHGVTRQTVFDRFKRAGLPRRPRPEPRPFVVFEGDRYTENGRGYWRRTTGTRSLLHQDVWWWHAGPIPKGWDIHHKNGDPSDNAIENLECLPKAAHTRLHNPVQPITSKRCACCGSWVKRHVGEQPHAYRKRKFCGMKCKGSWHKGRPLGAKAEPTE